MYFSKCYDFGRTAKTPTKLYWFTSGQWTAIAVMHLVVVTGLPGHTEYLGWIIHGSMQHMDFSEKL